MVLVVEDDDLVRMAAVDMIETLGFTALQAMDATEALSVLNGAERVDVLFTDIGLPGMRGPELAAKALETASRPESDLRQRLWRNGRGASDRRAAVHLGKPLSTQPAGRRCWASAEG